jgi:hypothetical protein
MNEEKKKVNGNHALRTDNFILRKCNLTRNNCLASFLIVFKYVCIEVSSAEERKCSSMA